MAFDTNTPGGRLEVLDGWRTVSVALVILSHFLIQSDLWPGQPLTRWEHEFQLMSERVGVVGVQIFFVISGFVICRGLIREGSVRTGVSLGAFYVRRCLRILPPLAVFVAVVYLLSAAGLLPSRADTIPRALTFTCDFPHASCGGWFGAHTWSLSVEEQFYLVFPLLFVIVGPGRKGWSLVVAGVLILSSVLLALSGSEWWLVLDNFIPISIGVACALHFSRISRLTADAPAWIVCLALLAALVLSRGYYTAYSPFFTAPIAILIAFMLMASLSPASAVNAALSAKPLVAIGRASYSIYLWQQLVTAQWPGAGPVFYVAITAALIPLALFSFERFETPLIALGARLSKAISKPFRSAAAPQPS